MPATQIAIRSSMGRWSAFSASVSPDLDAGDPQIERQRDHRVTGFVVGDAAQAVIGHSGPYSCAAPSSPRCAHARRRHSLCQPNERCCKQQRAHNDGRTNGSQKKDIVLAHCGRGGEFLYQRLMNAHLMPTQRAANHRTESRKRMSYLLMMTQRFWATRHWCGSDQL